MPCNLYLLVVVMGYMFNQSEHHEAAPRLSTDIEQRHRIGIGEKTKKAAFGLALLGRHHTYSDGFMTTFDSLIYMIEISQAPHQIKYMHTDELAQLSLPKSKKHHALLLVDTAPVGLGARTLKALLPHSGIIYLDTIDNTVGSWFRHCLDGRADWSTIRRDKKIVLG